MSDLYAEDDTDEVKQLAVWGWDVEEVRKWTDERVRMMYDGAKLLVAHDCNPKKMAKWKPEKFHGAVQAIRREIGIAAARTAAEDADDFDPPPRHQPSTVERQMARVSLEDSLRETPDARLQTAAYTLYALTDSELTRVVKGLILLLPGPVTEVAR